MTGDWQSALERARAHAPFLARGLERQPELAQLLAEGNGEASLAWAHAQGQSGAPGPALRKERLGYAIALAIGDLAGAYPVARVTRELSDLADRSLDRAISAAIARRVEGAGSDGFYALALGKQGAGELNYSSDIDPILLFDPQRLARRERDEPGEAAQRYAREVVKLLSEVTDEGYVFRVDLRLRPASEVSPLAVSQNAALTHYESSALAWERAAYIRARSCAGDIPAGETFLEAITPFVWRRSLDFGAIEEIGRLTSRIREAYRGPQRPGPGFDLKKGRGGIREIEFFAQTHQLIHGGRNPGLRVRGTRAALDALAENGLIAADDAQLLGDSYDRLRILEHRLQMVNDRQTHALPEGQALEDVARLDGLAGAKELVAEVESVTEAVGVRFDQLLETTTSPDRARPVAEVTAELVADGEEEAQRLADRIEGWLDGRYRTLRSPSARDAFRAILPQLVGALGSAPEPDRAILRFERLLENLPSAINLFRLLDARPGLLDQLLRILAFAPPLADELGRNATLLDTLIDQTALDLPPTVEELAAKMRRSDPQSSYEKLLDRIRIVTAEHRFALGVQLIEATHDPLEIAAGLSRVAEAALQVAVEEASREYARIHGTIAGGEMLVLGLGRLGGEALTHASDLDLIYLFTGDTSTESNGDRPLGATHYFNRLAQRISAALSVPTAEGALYEIDTRLRPQGNQGPLAVSVESFAKYQREAAWTWEHMALTRARVVAGPEAAARELTATLRDVLGGARDAGKLRADVLDMRAEMASHKPPKGPLDAKLLRGGLVDLEFIIHYLQLRERTGLVPRLGEACEALVDAGLLPAALIHAHDFLTRLIVGGRLLAPDLAMPEGRAGEILAGACHCAGTADLDRALIEARQCVADAWHTVFDEKLEIE
ncbi:bifunctional [glutamine synthetase] adenylyltransferase/[glutamine synthetase]-adenylyl-L-tyrosine phosphorylase [Parerythrobacter aestuarii]|uniref:bifunctional [glutamine synthetase] adenylyltransferase/[glutamine synthetase]-adenylyl-L-tyrosine phosphorylase n=1 Tax=Parerythrobacter aestuarii TaxID=3020909 RepID=UPI0024DEF541|nr:bifunctional [glutamine synthetase] adenylyltransferase/[glutamine synthetase]-adenylyl-L-tyrosine phosphorylase [Parerythrobacter aestuarii]